MSQATRDESGHKQTLSYSLRAQIALFLQMSLYSLSGRSDHLGIKRSSLSGMLRVLQ